MPRQKKTEPPSGKTKPERVIHVHIVKKQQADDLKLLEEFGGYKSFSCIIREAIDDLIAKKFPHRKHRL